MTFSAICSGNRPCAWVKNSCGLAAGLFFGLAAQAAPCTGGILKGLDRAAIAEVLRSPEGLAGTLHGKTPDRQGNPVVLTVRDPDDFFAARQLTLIPSSPDSAETLNLAKRNDMVCIRGSLAPFGGDQIHVTVSEVDFLEPFSDRYPDLPPYAYSGPNPEDLPPQGELKARIHSAEAELLVVEVGDRIMPVAVPQGMDISPLPWRFDTVTMNFRKAPMPGGITHLVLAGPALAITASLRADHGKATTVEGNLAVFPKSPLISRDTYAISRVDGDGFETTFTLVNLDDRAVFEAAQKKLADAWLTAENSGAITRGRNHFLNPTVRISVTGTLNVVSAAQANPQVIVSSPEDINVTVVSAPVPVGSAANRD